MINVTKAYLGNKSKFLAYVDRIYQSGWLTNHGPLSLALEERLKDYLGVRHVTLTNNGTIALQIAYRALGIKGSAITTPSASWRPPVRCSGRAFARSSRTSTPTPGT